MPDFSHGWPFLLWAQLECADSTGKQTIVSDEAWKWSPGPVTFSNIYAGEDFDARQEPHGWNAAEFDDSGWKNAQPAPPPSGKPTALDGPPIRRFEVFAPTEIKRPAAGVCTYVFPQNCSALVRVTVSGKAGAKIRLRPCEYLEPNGRVKFTYTWGTGDGEETYEPWFFYVGAQYVQVDGAVPEGDANPDGLPVIRKLELVHVRAACPAVGEFRTSSELHNRAMHLIDWSIRANMSYFPTDCPHREKNSWIEQDWHMARAISYRFDVRDWYAKLCRDIADTQQPDGHIPTNSPNYLVGIPPNGYWNNSAEWGIAGVLAPWHVYEWYGDRRVLENGYDAARRYVDFLAASAKDGILTSNLGDWYDYGHGKGDGPSRWTPNEVSATAIWALGARTLSGWAKHLGRDDDATRYRDMYGRIGTDFRGVLYDPTSKAVRNNGSPQAANSVAIAAGLIPEADREAAIQAIVEDLAKRDWQQTTGEVLQVFLIRTLAENGRGDVLHRVFNREERGSYGFMARSGLTTLPESWDAKPGTGNSMCHFMLGHLMEWHFAYVAGIRQAQDCVGWTNVLIAPQPPAEVTGKSTAPGGLPNSTNAIRRAEASFVSPRGRISSRWEASRNELVLVYEAPAGVRGEVILPDGSRSPLVAGTPQVVKVPLGR
ncbi:MAG: family 78 glycoside hydrolase catalytic domain [Planctomycetes bacterium]|nr:family 78 glycoside hydrolase catalytic domain [Planctomycetota bacterium]